MSALARVRAGGRSLDGRLAAVPAEALLAGLRAAGAVSEPEVAALGAPASGGWAGRLRALAVAKGDRTCGVLLSVLRRLEGPPRPGPFDFYDPQRDAAPAHRSDCPCCRPEPEWTRGEEEEEEEEGPKIGDEGREEEEEENPKNEEGDEGHEDDEEGDEGHEDDDGGGGDEGHEEEEEEETENGDEGHEDDDDDGGGDEGPENDGGDGDDDDGGGGDEGPDDDDDGGGGDED